ncbi:hypothetical protein [Paraburkholderia saeva]|jgi:hypothetical protein|uniref:DUF2846 domain-containing protein n=1 Tax=Paraburkholderia saeva TaxID=2777537 RepID=A0A9N8S1B0_9BURK|nr:hypothetical protein [Paraburkholderia saeva]CAG4896821.1 hypothetical protein R52603_02247 [Paraburkholderia saeva]CAG4921477.1 hypothetical protein LMG31841_05091 [Paraburkholderia saeva]
MPLRLPVAGKFAAGAALVVCFAALTGCASEPAGPVPYKDVPVARIVKPGYTEPEAGKIAVDVRRERSGDVVIRFRDALVYVDGEQVTDLMNGERVIFYLSPGMHRIAVSTQFDPVIEMQFMVTGHYTNHASVTFNAEHRIELHRVPK